MNLENSSIDSSYGAGAVFWNGGTANIVSSVISDSGGLSIADGATDGVLNFVNSILYMTGGDDLSQTQRIQAADGGEANVLASSILYDSSNTSSTGCDSGISYGCNGMPLTATQGGLLRFDSSVALPLSADFFFPGKESYSEFSSGDLVADDYSYIAATQAQDANAVKSLFNNLNVLTEGYTYDLIVDALVPELAFFYPLPGGAVPALDGVLVGVIPDAGPGGENQLINPIDGRLITTDVYGNPRTNAFGVRDIGAVQVPEPPSFLAALAGFVLYRTASARKRKCRAAVV